MGVIKQGILGGFSNKVAGLVGTSWKGIAVIKAMPLSVANPRTAGQVEQRSNFGSVVAVAVLLLASIIKPLWDRFASKMSGYNAFVSANVDKFTAGVFTTFATFAISKGKMSNTAISSVTAINNDDSIDVNWSDDSGSGYKLATDEAYVVIYNATQDNWGFGADGSQRSSESSTFTMPTPVITGNVLHCYLAFRRADGTIVSDTAYLLKTV